MQDWILDNADHLAAVLQSETGKPRTEATIEAPLCADLIKYWAGHAKKFLADLHPAAHSPLMKVKRLTTVYRPYPVVGLIIPWNFPLLNIALDGIAPLAAGAAVLLKPSEVTPLSSVEFARGWAEIGAPPVLSLTTGYAETGAAAIANSDCVHFTGSTATGRTVAVACAERLIPCTLELGGKDPAIVLADADLDRAAAGIAWGGMFNSGQVCVSVERVYVEAPVYDEFVAKLTDEVARLRQGKDDDHYRFDVGAMATPAQRDIVARHVDDAVAAGGRVTTGGKPTGVGTFYEPTVLADVASQWRASPRRRSARRCPWSRSPTKTKQSGWPTTPATGCRRRCGRRTSHARSASPVVSMPAPSTSTMCCPTDSVSPCRCRGGRTRASAHVTAEPTES